MPAFVCVNLNFSVFGKYFSLYIKIFSTPQWEILFGEWLQFCDVQQMWLVDNNSLTHCPTTSLMQVTSHLKHIISFHMNIPIHPYPSGMCKEDQNW
jgi:hypothetical protein